MTTTPNADADSRAILDAIANGVTGDHQAAFDLLLPILKRDPQSMYGVLCALAEMASAEMRLHQKPGDFFGIEVEHLGGAEASISDAPPGVRFATQFVTAWANRDQDTADALCLAMYDGDFHALVVGIRLVYDMAIVALKGVLEQQRGSAQ